MHACNNAQFPKMRRGGIRDTPLPLFFLNDQTPPPAWGEVGGRPPTTMSVHDFLSEKTGHFSDSSIGPHVVKQAGLICCAYDMVPKWGEGVSGIPPSHYFLIRSDPPASIGGVVWGRPPTAITEHFDPLPRTPPLAVPPLPGHTNQHSAVLPVMDLIRICQPVLNGLRFSYFFR